MKTDRIITKKDDIFFYFEMLKNVNPHSILDVGMFLKRIGAISRQAMSYEIPPEVKLCGIDIFPENALAVYQKVYDEILNLEEFMNSQSFSNSKKMGTTCSRKYDVAVMLRLFRHLNLWEEELLWHYCLSEAEAIMTDMETAERQTKTGWIKAYYPVAAGSGQYAFIPTEELRGAL